MEILERKIIWDDIKNHMNKLKHGVDFYKAAQVFSDKFRIEKFDELHSEYEDRYITIGKVDDILFVVYTERGDFTRLISARPANKQERMEYYVNGQNFGY